MSENPYANMTDEELDAKEQEILARQKKRKMSQKNNDPYANMTDEELDAKEQEILQKRQKKAPAPEPTLMDRVSQFGSGLMHSLGEGALNSQNPEEDMWSPNTYSGQPGEVPNSLAPETRDYLKNYIQTQQPSQNADLTERILHGAGQWIGEGVKLPIVPGWSNAVTNLDRLRAIGRTAGLTAAGGATSGTLQQAGVNPGVADLSAGFLTPLGIGALKKGAAGVGYALSPNMREQAAKAKGEKIARFGFKKSLEGLEEAPTENIGEAINVEHNKKPFLERVEAEDAGKDVRDSLAKKKKKLEDIRTEKTEPLYKELENSNQPFEPKESLFYIEKKIRNAQGKIRKALKEYQKELGGSKKNTSKKELNEFRDFQKEEPEIFELVGDILNPTNKKIKGKRAGQLDSIRQDLSDAIEEAYKKGNKRLGTILKELKVEVTKDLEKTPVGLKHSNEYRIFSKPINKLEKDAIGDILKKDVHGEDYLVKNLEVMNPFTGSGRLTQYNAKKLLEQIGTDKKTLDSVKKYINGQVLDYILENGQINRNKLETWKAKHKGAFILDPSLEKKISKLSNAQLFSQNMIKNYSKLPLIDALDKVPAKILKKMGRKIVGFDLLIDKVLEMKKSKELGYARDLFENALKDPKAAEALLKPVKELSKTEKISKTLTPYVNAIKPKKHEEGRIQ